MCLTPVLSERHVGIDPGRKNFAISCVDKYEWCPPKVVAAELYNLELPKQFGMLDLANALLERTDLFDWMQLRDGENSLELVDRVVVHIEMMSFKNANSRQFTIELAKCLQSSAFDINKCVVKLSQANVHRRSGPIFKMGNKIVESLSLMPSNDETRKQDFKRKRQAVLENAALTTTASNCRGEKLCDCRASKRRKVVTVTSQSVGDVYESDDEDNEGTVSSDYRRRKKCLLISSSISCMQLKNIRQTLE